MKQKAKVSAVLEGNPAIPKGLRLPQWTTEMSAGFMGRNHIDPTIFSLPVPMPVLGKGGIEAAVLRREVNEYIADLHAH